MNSGRCYNRARAGVGRDRKEVKLDAGRKVEADVAVSTADGAGARCCLAGSSYKDRAMLPGNEHVNICKHIASIPFLCESCQKNGAHNPPPTESHYQNSSASKVTFFSLPLKPYVQMYLPI